MCVYIYCIGGYVNTYDRYKTSCAVAALYSDEVASVIDFKVHVLTLMQLSLFKYNKMSYISQV